MAKTKTGARPEVPETPDAPVVRRKTDEERRDDRIPVRVTASQKAVLTEAASRAGLDVSAWLRSLGMERAASLHITEASVKVTEGPKAQPPATAKSEGDARPKE